MALKGPEALIALDRCRGRTTGWGKRAVPDCRISLFTCPHDLNKF